MTTKPTYQILSVIDYANLDFDPNEPEPLPEAMEQNPTILRIINILDAHLKSQYPPGEVFIDTNTPVCYNRDNLNDRVMPDVYIAFDVDAPAIRERKLYLPWEAGKPPDFVLEVGSESTSQNDLGPKRDRYAQIGVLEYWRFDPSGGGHHGQPLTGERLVNGVYLPIELTTEPDGILKGHSPILGRSLCWQDGIPELYDPDSNTYHRDLTQAEAALQNSEAALQSSEAALESSDAALNAERIARQAAEARIRELEEELRRQQGGS